MTLLILPGVSNAQWTVRQNMGAGNNRTFSTSFSVNGKIYIVGGQFNYNGLSDVWEYNVSNDSWAQKSTFPGGLRGGAAAFSIGTKSYFMCGCNYAGQFFDDVWEYDSSIDTWTQKGDFPGGKREELVAFTIGGKGYVGMGYEEIVGPNSTISNTYADFWEYDPAFDSWTQKTLLPGQPRGWAIGASIGGKGYVGLGSNSSQNLSYSDFYEFDPANNTWTLKASYGLTLGDAMSFIIGQEMYVCGGIDFSNYSGSSTLKKYNPATDTWTSLQAMAAGVTMGAIGITCNNRGFVGTGYNAALNEKDDWWEFAVSSTLCPTPVAYNASTFATNGTVQCNGKIVISNITNGCPPYTVSVIPGTGPVFTLTGSSANFTITNLCVGTYSVKVIDNNCCGPTQKTCVIPANLTSGLTSTNMSGNSIDIFPNPSEGKFKIATVDMNNFNIEKIHITNAIGKEVKFKVGLKEDLIGIDLSENGKGIYFFSYDDGKIQLVRKVVVQ